MTHFKRIAAFLMAGVLLSGCSGNEKPVTDTTTTDNTTTTVETTKSKKPGFALGEVVEWGDEKATTETSGTSDSVEWADAPWVSVDTTAQITTSEPLISEADPLEIEKMLLAYINDEGELDTEVLKAVTELKIYGQDLISVSCGKNKGTDYGIIYSLGVGNFSGYDMPIGTVYTRGALSDLSFIKHCINAKHIEISFNSIEDISPLCELNNIKALYLNENKINDISCLSKMSNLEEIELSGNKIGDISVLKDIPKLTRLDLSYNQISDISCLNDKTNLTHLSLGDNYISDISCLSSLKSMTFLRLTNNQITDIAPLKELTDLTFLALGYNNISDILMLQNLQALEMLYLTPNPYTQADGEALQAALPDCMVNYWQPE